MYGIYRVDGRSEGAKPTDISRRGPRTKHGTVFRVLGAVMARLPGAFMLVLALSAVLSAPAAAQQRVNEDRRKPALLYQLMSGNPTNESPVYGSVEEAFEKWKKWSADGCAQCPPGACCGSCQEILTLPAPEGVNPVWGEPAMWCHTVNVDYGYPPPGTPCSKYFVKHCSIHAYLACPVGYTYSGLIPSGGTGTPGDPYQYKTYCSKALPAAPVCERAHGNPVYASSGRKVQTETISRSSFGPLQFSLTYDSSLGSFSSDFEVDFRPPKPWSVQTEACLSTNAVAHAGSITKHIPRCFASVNYPGNLASFHNRNRAREDFVFNGNAWQPTASEYTDRLAEINWSGAPAWMLSRPDKAEVLIFNPSGQLLRLLSASGGGVSVAYHPTTGYLVSATDDFGRSLLFDYVTNTSGQRELASITLPGGVFVRFEYDSAHRLIKTRNETAGTDRRYLWDEAAYATGTNPGTNRLTGIVDESNVRYATFRYVNGMAVGTEHANGADSHSIVDSRSGGAGTITVTDPTGNVSASVYALVNGLSREVSSSQPAGSGCGPASSATAYDSNGNVASRDDFTGVRTCHAYDMARNLETSRVEGLANTQACSAVTPVSATLPSGSRKTSTAWHPDWRLAVKVAEPKRLTTNVYNGQPDPFAGNAIASCAPTTAKLPDGKPIAVLCKTVEQATYDTGGAAGFTAALDTSVPNRVWSYTYNEFGLVLTSRDPRGNTTTNSYYTTTTAGYTRGDLEKTTGALPTHVTRFTKYNPMGQVLQSIDANNVATDYEYDPRQRLKRQTTAGQSTIYDYWPTGQLKRVTQPDTSYVDYEYDPAQRLVAVADNLGNRIEYSLDNSGRQREERVKDPTGALKRQVSRAFDALGRTQQITGRE